MERLKNPRVWALAAIAAVYLAVSMTFALVKPPSNDEGWFAAPARDLAANGSLGMPTLDPTGSWLAGDLPGIREHAYWNMPLGMVVQGTWSRLAGFGLFRLRMLSILFGVLTLGSWFVLVRQLTGDAGAALAGSAFLAIDYTFLWGAAEARPDMICSALGWAGVAAYLLLRNRDLRAALLVANTLVAAGLFTHPNGVMAFTALALLVLYYDRRRLEWRHAVAILPYVAGAAAWGAWIAEDPRQFLAQFAANAGARGGLGGRLAKGPLNLLFDELVTRYLFHFGPFSLWTGPVSALNVLIPAIYWGVALAALSLSGIRKRAGNCLLLALLGICFVVLLAGLKLPYYLPYIMPAYAAVMGVWTLHCWRRRARHLALAVVAVLALLQAGAIVQLIHADRYHRCFIPAMEYVQRNAPPGAAVVGTSTAALALGYGGMTDDARLGYFSGIQPDFIVADRPYTLFWQAFRAEQPEVEHYIRLALSSDYELAFKAETYRVYRRKAVRDRAAVRAGP